MLRFKRGFGCSNLNLIRQFYLSYQRRRPILQSLIGESSAPPGDEVTSPSPRGFALAWTHYVRLLPVDDPAKLDSYEKEARRAGWSVREIDRQINSMLYERIALSRKKGELLQQAEQQGNQEALRKRLKIHTFLNSWGFRSLIPKRILRMPSFITWQSSSLNWTTVLHS